MDLVTLIYLSKWPLPFVCYVLIHLHGHGRLWQTAHRVEQTLQLSRHVVLFMGKVFKMFKILKINCRLALRILSSEADKTESETKITWALGPSLANLASRSLWASTHFSTWRTFFATIFSHPASTWATSPPGELCILDLSESSMSWLRCSKKALWDVKRMYFITGGINDIIVCRGRLETSGDKRQKEKFWTFSREVETWWCGVILKLYWRTDGLPISGVFCLQGKVSFLHFLHNLLKTEHL